MIIRTRRVYDPPSPEDGRRLLVDRLWPRGVKKEALHLDGWLKEAAPSDELRRWFQHVPARWPQFRRRYFVELHQHAEALEQIRAAAAHGPVTLLFGARDTEHNNSVALREYVMSQEDRQAPRAPEH
jgi:uncharacterized protein YeaO (DUF488 family)